MPEVSVVTLFKATGEAHVRPRHPQRVYILSRDHEDPQRDEDFAYAAVVAETDSPALARWLASAVNACLAHSPLEGLRPAGRLLRHGSFRVAEDEYSAVGLYFCVAWDVALPRGSTLGYSTTASQAQNICDQLATLMASLGEVSL